MKVDFKGFIDLVNLFGGVDVNVPFNFKQATFIDGTIKEVQFKKGKQHLNGAEALAYVRMRHKDPKGDLGRNARQREVIENLLDKAATIATITKIGDVFDVLETTLPLI